MDKERKKEKDKERSKTYYYLHREEILRKYKEHYKEKKEMEGQIKTIEILYRPYMETESYIVFTTHAKSGKHLGYEVQKRLKTKDEYGVDKFSFTSENQVDYFINNHGEVLIERVL